MGDVDAAEIKTFRCPKVGGFRTSPCFEKTGKLSGTPRRVLFNIFHTKKLKEFKKKGEKEV